MYSDWPTFVSFLLHEGEFTAKLAAAPRLERNQAICRA